MTPSDFYSLSRPEQLFAWMCEDTRKLDGEDGTMVLCPLCFRRYSANDLHNKILSEDHIVLKSLGGRKTVLTCKRCNNEFGSRLEAHLVEHIKCEDAAFGEKQIRASLIIDGNRTANELIWPTDPEKPVQLRLLQNFSDPNSVNKSLEALRSGKSPITLNVRTNFIPGRVSSALLKMAYLALYTRGGYQAISTDFMSSLLTQIRNYQKWDPRFNPLLPQLDNVGWNSDDEFVVLDLPQLGCHLVVARYRLEGTYYKAVFLPSLNSDPNQVLKRLTELATINWTARVSTTTT